MALISYIDTPSPIHRFDPRARFLACCVGLLGMAIANQPVVLATASAGLLSAMLIAGLPPRSLARRIIALNLFLALWWVTLPVMEGERGLQLAVLATARANAMALLISLLVSTIEATALAHALAHLRVPRKLIHILLFTIRYAEILLQEQQRMFRAMRARAFRPAPNAHTYRSFAGVIGTLILRSLDRADRILVAMKCRGYRGEFYLLHHFNYHARDAALLVGALVFSAWIVYAGRG